MKFVAQALPEVMLVEPTVHEDARGFFLETYHEEKYRAGGITCRFVQDNHSRSARATLRGLHAQIRSPQAKLVRVVAGEIFDVAVDIRESSPTFGRYVGARLSASNHRQLFVPVGFAHGFCVLSESAEVEYKCSELYSPGDEVTIAWDDRQLGIEWPVDAPLLSARDAAAPPLAQLRGQLFP